ncbi:MAG TPA: alpha/beta fold hydrolase [Gemmatimonadales bacterium]|jgi:pimeloyl-ACP methyl ester carboxylesterase/acyl-CoA thioesterase FadM|nr:alpha/beta fold hydrolase [Gemmatimonadales bacterium]
MTPPEVDFTVYPDECDTFGHLNQASFLSLFERARWEMLARGPGMDLFTRTGSWPVVRKTVVDYLASALPGDVLRFNQTLLHHGRTSFTMRQTARRLRDDTLMATGEFVLVCINRDGQPVPVPEALSRFMESRGASGSDNARRYTVNGVNLAVELAGEGSVLLMVHGYPLDRSIWRHPLENLRSARRIAPDLRGFGASDAPDLGYSMATYAADLSALLDTLGVEQVVLCGLSMGGYVAFEFVRHYRARVKGLVLVATRAEPDSPETRRNRDAAAASARERGVSAVVEAMLPKLLAPESYAKAGLLQSVRDMIERTPVAGIVGALAAMRDRPDSTPLLAALGDIPVLVVAGEHDQVIPLPDITRMRDAIPGAALRVIPKAGHLVTMEQPEQFTRALQDFLVSVK